jgi:apolipoprotein N-acyltransferase
MSEPRKLRWWVAALVAILGGLALDAATPWLEWWAAGFLGAALVAAAVWQQRFGVGVFVGALAGAAFWMPQISWLTLYLGPIPWLALSGVMIAWFALFGGLAAFVTRTFAALRCSQGIIVTAQTVVVTGLWVAREQVQSTWPYGGFAWGRLAHTQADGPYAALASWLGFSGLSAFVALVGVLCTAGAFAFWRRRNVMLILSASIAAVMLALVFVQPASLETTGTIRVAAVQGNSKSGIFDDRENGDVFRDHLDTTLALIDELEAANEHVDVIVWPENSAEFQITEQTHRLRALQSLAVRAEAPIIVGTILRDGDDVFTNSSLVIDPAEGVGARYDKRRPVPFAEYMPNRAFFRSLVPQLVDLVQLDYAFGARPSVLEVPTTSTAIQAGIAICFDIIFDDHAAIMMHEGAEIIFAQTNNADFGATDESAQQLQIARLRAVETGRALVNISTVGTSAIIAPDGGDLGSLTPFTADTMVAEVPLVRGNTPALTYGPVMTAVWLVVGLGGLAVAGIGRLRRRRQR